MRYQFYREHKYVSAALNDLERAIARTDFCDSKAVEEIKNSFSGLAEMLKGHAHYENERLHLLLRQKNSQVLSHTHVEEEHAVQDQHLLEIEKILESISQNVEAEKKIELGHQLYLTYRKFVADNLAHLHEEETQLLPELQKLYSDMELQLVETQTYREMTPEQMVHMLETLFPHMNTYDRQALLIDILSLEPEKFELVWKTIQLNMNNKERVAIEQLMNKKRVTTR